MPVPGEYKMAIKREKYLDLMRQFPPRPIRPERDLDRAAKVIDSLIDRPSLSSDKKDYLNVLSTWWRHTKRSGTLWQEYRMPEWSDT